MIEELFTAKNSRLWNAITRHEEMRLWFFNNIHDFKAEVGFKTSFRVKSEERTFTHLWHVTEVVPLQKITYNWKYEEYAGDSFVTFELFDEGENVRLKLTMDIVKDFPDDVPEFSRNSCIGGWNYFIGENLKNYLEEKK